MTGEMPKECHLCIKSNSARVYKDDLNRDFRHLMQEIFEKTQDDGSTTMEPKYLDFRFLTCNLSCLTCSSSFSSKWFQVMKEINPQNSETLPDSAFYRDEYKRVLKKYKWERVYYAGGEPLLVPRHLEDLDVLLALEKEDESFSIGLFYNTNLQQRTDFLSAWAEKINQFKNPNIYASIDSAGRYNELIRVGSNFQNTEKNLLMLKNMFAPHVAFKIDITITAVLLAEVNSFVEWILKHQFSLNAHMMIGGGIGRILRQENLKLTFREKVLSDWNKRFSSLNKQDQNLLSDLNHALTTHLLAPEFTEEEKRENILALEKAPFPEIVSEVKNLLVPLM